MNKDAPGVPRVQDVWVESESGVFDELMKWSWKEGHYRFKVWYHPTESRGHRILVGQFDKAGIVANPDGEYEPSKKDLGVEIGHLLKNSGDNIGDLFAQLLENQAQSSGPGFEAPNLDGLGEGLGQLVAGIFEGLGSG